jgi:hypothetical protein
MKNKLIFSIMLVSLLIINNQALASTTNGTVDSTDHYAWGENVGFVDFKNITITDTALAGSAYGENIGWIDLSTVTNTNAGVLGGYAWGENIGWVDFSKTTIGVDGVFTGGAYGENIGWITFGTTNNKVLTDWRPLSVRPVHTTSGSTLAFRQKFLAQQNKTPAENSSNIQAGKPFTISRILKQNTRGDDVRNLQTYLNTHGYPLATTGPGSPGQETNIFGPKTKKAVIKFQKANNLITDGIVGPITRNLMN